MSSKEWRFPLLAGDCSKHFSYDWMAFFGKKDRSGSCFSTKYFPCYTLKSKSRGYKIWLVSTFLGLPKVINLSSSQNKSLKQLFHRMFTISLISRVRFLIVQTYSFKDQERVFVKLITEKRIKHFKRDIMAESHDSTETTGPVCAEVFSDVSSTSTLPPHPCYLSSWKAWWKAQVALK